MNTPAPSPHLTHDQMHAVLTDWHAQCVDDPLYIRMSHSFEDMADILSRAQRDLKGDQDEAAWVNHDNIKVKRLGAVLELQS